MTRQPVDWIQGSVAAQDRVEEGIRVRGNPGSTPKQTQCKAGRALGLDRVWSGVGPALDADQSGRAAARLSWRPPAGERTIEARYF